MNGKGSFPPTKERMIAPSTVQAYERDIVIFTEWCNERSLRSLPPVKPSVLAAFIADEHDSGVASSTLARRAAAITWTHRQARYPSPCDTLLVRDALRSARVKHAQRMNESSIVLDRILDVIDGNTLVGLRDASLLSLYFTGEFTRWELVGLHVEQVSWRAHEGVVIDLRERHSYDSGHDKRVYLRYVDGGRRCPIVNLRRYLTAAAIEEGAIFRRATSAGTFVGSRTRQLEGLQVDQQAHRTALSARSVAVILKRHAISAGVSLCVLPGGRRIARYTG